MRIATWNINSVRTRTQRALDLISKHDIDVLCLQETKVKDDKFPREPFEEAGLHVTCHGLNQWNGVAIVSTDAPEEVFVGFPGQPGFAKDPDKPQDREARALGARIRGVEMWSLYVPNGREITDRHYDYKLDFLYHLAHYAENNAQSKLLLTGDFNIAPRDEDVWDIEAFRGKTHVTEPERAAFQMLEESGLEEVTRRFTEDQRYTYFDYKGMRFQKNEGMRIDFQLASAPLAQHVTGAQVDLVERAGDKASDHCPLLADFNLPDFDSVR
ncbi:exodeoxyribonuclease III [Corynebacterium kefirresidentii]|uniref:exodeoxyribonuclease III n=1 Tax=Corynebacterium TaxID=1716 RepID=UPI0003B9086D|nr:MULTISPECIES: exodeoxyribonuclease III [Corynebacterium]WKS53091.1 exodeoxyribonuclease III [Corynebacterium tuberculostearicum]ERS50976.1 exodeoxyribonuclease III [Corynebacterium sp. KPL1860]ERS51549.1 exodeoxyribonuclease III [Corynebacterium sp. KPL1856]ERS56124.1 exodeoxyribonuclease III [Corynebacterium sp. KPL1821]ERS59062.1 exodeoxyribonuclease III [Corynebacterium sp. KPL1817]